MGKLFNCSRIRYECIAHVTLKTYVMICSPQTQNLIQCILHAQLSHNRFGPYNIFSWKHNVCSTNIWYLPWGYCIDSIVYVNAYMDIPMIYLPHYSVASVIQNLCFTAGIQLIQMKWDSLQFIHYNIIASYCCCARNISWEIRRICLKKLFPHLTTITSIFVYVISDLSHIKH